MSAPLPGLGAELRPHHPPLAFDRWIEDLATDIAMETALPRGYVREGLMELVEAGLLDPREMRLDLAAVAHMTAGDLS